MTQREKGFTLVEMLVSTAIAAVIAVAMSSFLFSSLHAIQILDLRNSAAQADLVLGLEKISKEVQSSPVFPAIPFEGSHDQFSFPVLLSPGDLPPLEDFRLGQIQKVEITLGAQFKKVRYFFDAGAKKLMRQVGDSDAKTFIEHVNGVKVFYAIRSRESSDNWSWQETTPLGASAQEIGAMAIHLTPESRYREEYVMPVIKKTFLIARVHPVDFVEPGAEEAV